MRAVIQLVILVFGCFSAVQASSTPLVFGAYKYQTEEVVTKEIGGLVKYLQKATGREIQLEVLNSEEFLQKVRNGALDVLWINPNLYEILRYEDFLTGIMVTTERTYKDIATTSLGGVIFSRADQALPNSLEALTAQMKIAVPSKMNTGAFRIPVYEFFKLGIDYQQFEYIEVGSNFAVVDAVLSGKADVGFVRNSILERYLAQNPSLSLERFQIHNSQGLKSYPYHLSTDLYPEWPVVVMPQVEIELSRKIATALYQLTPESAEIDGTMISGFVPPLNYKPYENILRALNVYPFYEDPTPSIRQIWDSYFQQIVSVGSLFVLMVAGWWHALRQRRSLAAAHLETQSKNQQLLQLSRERLEQKKELQRILDTALEGIAVMDLDTQFLYTNRQYSRMLGYSQAELKTLSCYDLTHADYQEKTQDIYSAVMEQGFYENFERFCLTKNGSLIRINSSITLMEGGQHFLIASQDVTERYELLQTIKDQALMDELTQLYNRKAFNQKLHELMASYQRYQAVFSMLILDVDYFKSINDQFGHQAGDQVLQKLSAKMTALTRKTDFVFRIGGEEFVVLLPNTAGNAAIKFAQKLRQAVAQEGALLADHQITVSIGVSQVQPNETEDSFFKRADDCLYQAKRSGRNKVMDDLS